MPERETQAERPVPEDPGAKEGQRPDNIVLIGMMGTGKTTAGALAAAELGYSLVDLDADIQRAEGRSIPELFAQEGEAYFRRAETKALAKAMKGKHQVIATGGGAVLAEENVELMLAGGTVIALTATADEIVARVAGDSGRPLLAGNAEERVRQLLEQRRDAYRFAHCTVDTTGVDAAEVSRRILAYCRVGAFKRDGY